MAKVEFFIKNEAGKEEVRRSREITTRDYRNFLMMQDQIESGELNKVEELDVQIDFLVNLFEDVTVEEILEHTDYAGLYEILVKVFESLIGGSSEGGKK